MSTELFNRMCDRRRALATPNLFNASPSCNNIDQIPLTKLETTSDMSCSSASTTTLDISKAAQSMDARIPPFYDSAPTLWFQATENLFRLKNISSDHEQYLVAFSALQIPHLNKLRPDLDHLNALSSYQVLKQKLVDTFTRSNDDKLHELLYDVEPGDRLPTELLCHMRDLLGRNNSPEILRKLFLDKLPSDTRKLLILSPTDDLDELAKLADKISSYSRASSKNLRSTSQSDVPFFSTPQHRSTFQRPPVHPSGL